MELLREKAEHGAKIKTPRVCQSEEQSDGATQRQRERPPTGFTLPDHSLESQQITNLPALVCPTTTHSVPFRQSAKQKQKPTCQEKETPMNTIQWEARMDLRVRGRKEAAPSLPIINTHISSNRVWFLALMSFSAHLTSWESLGGRGMHHLGNAKRAHSGREKKNRSSNLRVLRGWKKANPTEWRELNRACRVVWEPGLRPEQKRPWLFGILHRGSELTRPSRTSHVASQQGSVLVGGEVRGKEGRENEVCLAISAYKTSIETSLALQLYYRQEPMLLGRHVCPLAQLDHSGILHCFKPSWFGQ